MGAEHRVRGEPRGAQCQRGLAAVRDQMDGVRAAPAGQRLGDLRAPVAPAVQEHQLDVASVVAARQHVVDEVLVTRDGGIDEHPLVSCGVVGATGSAGQGDPENEREAHEYTHPCRVVPEIRHYKNSGQGET